MSPALARVLLTLALLWMPAWTGAQTLVGCWPMDGTANDTSGNGLNGSAVGSPTYTTGQLGQGIALNGSTQWVTVAHTAALNITGDITLAAWVQKNSPTRQEALLAKTNGTIWDYDLYTRNAGGGFGTIAFYADGVTPTDVVGSAAITDTAFHHLAATRSGSTVTFYVDGISSGSASMSGSFGTNSFTLYLGTDISGSLDGVLDDVALYSGAMTGGQIGTLMTAGCTPSGGGAALPRVFHHSQQLRRQ